MLFYFFTHSCKANTVFFFYVGRKNYNYKPNENNLKITTFPFDCDSFFLGGDFISAENYVLINDRNQIVRNGILLEMPISLVFTNASVAVKIISPTLFLLVNRDIICNDILNARPNTWIINNKGEIEKAIYLGSVDKIMVHHRFLEFNKRAAAPRGLNHR